MALSVKVQRAVLVVANVLILKGKPDLVRGGHHGLFEVAVDGAANSEQDNKIHVCSPGRSDH